MCSVCSLIQLCKWGAPIDGVDAIAVERNRYSACRIRRGGVQSDVASDDAPDAIVSDDALRL